MRKKQLKLITFNLLNVKLTHMKSILSLVLIIGSIVLQSIAYAAKPVYVGGRDRAAIRGYDAVAYFTENMPVKGSKEHLFEYKGAKWLFSSADNLNLFKSNPEKYAPQFGGYCAYAVSKNTTASIKPEYFSIVDDKLYLNYSKGVYKRWTADKEKFIAAAEKNWPKVIED